MTDAMQKFVLEKKRKLENWGAATVNPEHPIAFAVLRKLGGFAGPDSVDYWPISAYEVEVVEGVVSIHDRHLQIPVKFYAVKGWLEIGLVRKQSDGSWIEYFPGQ